MDEFDTLEKDITKRVCKKISFKVCVAIYCSVVRQKLVIIVVIIQESPESRKADNSVAARSSP